MKVEKSASDIIMEAIKITYAISDKNILTKEVFECAIFTTEGTLLEKWLKSKGIGQKVINIRRGKIIEQFLSEKRINIKTGSMMNFLGRQLIISSNMAQIFEELEAINNYNEENEIGFYEILLVMTEFYESDFYKGIEILYPEYEGENILTEIEVLAKETIEGFTLSEELSDYLTIMNSKDGNEMCKICGREKETDALIRILMKNTKRNAILVGEPGVGKTAIVEKFAWMISSGNCPEKFKNCIVLSLDVNSIIAGTMYRGMAEERFKDLVKFLNENPECILFIDEIHLILGAGACREGGVDLANVLKPLLARGESRIIGATTNNEYERFFAKDGALKRRFEKIVVKEPKTSEVYDMIKNQIKQLEKVHNTTISKKLVNSVIFEASCFNYETKNPDRTLDLLDKTMVCAEMENRKNVVKADILRNFDTNTEKFRRMSAKIKLATAYHEAGHCIVHEFSELAKVNELLAISIIPTENYLGVNVFDANSNETISGNRNFYIQKIAECLAGRIAEKMYTSEISDGAESDLREATNIAIAMVTKLSLEPEMHNRVYGEENLKYLITDEEKLVINKKVDLILQEAYKYAENVLMEKEEYLKVLANQLMTKGILSKREVTNIFKSVD